MTPIDVIGLGLLTGIIWLTLFFLFDKTHRQPSRSSTLTQSTHADHTS